MPCVCLLAWGLHLGWNRSLSDDITAVETDSKSPFQVNPLSVPNGVIQIQSLLDSQGSYQRSIIHRIALGRTLPDATMLVGRQGPMDSIANFSSPTWYGRLDSPDASTWLTIKFSKPRTIHHFFMTAQSDHANRMPSHVEFEGMNDSGDWIRIPATLTVARHSERILSVESPIPYSQYRFLFSHPTDGGTTISLHSLILIEYFTRSSGTLIQIIWDFLLTHQRMGILNLLLLLTVAACFHSRFRTWMMDHLSPVKPTRGAFLAPLDAVRGLSALCIALYHYRIHLPDDATPYMSSWDWLIQGSKAVPVFVMISGFLVYRSIRSGWEARGYAIRRICRVMPAYLIMILVLFALYPQDFSNPQFNHFLSNLVMTHILSPISMASPQVWSLYVEICFYLFFPFYIALSGKRVLQVSGVFFILYSFIDPHAGPETHLWRYFFAGIIICEIHERFPRISRLKSGLFLLSGTLMLYWDLKAFDPLTDQLRQFFQRFNFQWITLGSPHPYTLELALGWMLLFLGMLHSNVINKISSFIVFRILGSISYGIFIWHMVLLYISFPRLNIPEIHIFHPEGLALTLYLGAVIMLSILSYLLIEKPVMQWGKVASRLKPQEMTST